MKRPVAPTPSIPFRTPVATGRHRKRRRRNRVVYVVFASAVLLMLWVSHRAFRRAVERPSSGVRPDPLPQWETVQESEPSPNLRLKSSSMVGEQTDEDEVKQQQQQVEEEEKEVDDAVEQTVRSQELQVWQEIQDPWSAFRTSQTKNFQITEVRPEYLKELSARLGQNCFVNSAPGPVAENRRQICCSKHPPSSVVPQDLSCLPNLVVMGAQKGGTTALHSYLMLYEGLSAAYKKELHIWDSDRTFRGWSSGLIRNFPRAGPSLVRFESSPSYLASTMACQRMASWLSPWTIYVVILRDPVKRFWSEYNMKWRRIEQQDMTMNSVLKHREDILRCAEEESHFTMNRKAKVGFEKLKPRKPPKLKASCWASLFSPRGKVKGSGPKLAAIERTLSSSTYIDESNGFINECIRDAKKTLEENRQCFRKFGALKETLPVLPDVLTSEMKSLEPCTKKLTTTFPVKQTEFTASGISTSNPDCVANVLDTFCATCRTETSPGCLQECIDSSEGAKQELIQRGCSLGENLKLPFPRKMLTSPDSCEGETCSCYPKVINFADISKNFLWRGMYYPQLVTCFRHIPRHQLVILENEELRKSTNETLNRVLEAAGLPPLDYSKFTWEDADRAFDAKYPNFESTTGWSADGSSSRKMPENIELLLRHFYKEPNEKLFQLLGKRFDHWL